jgi:hypothetical protein
MPKKISAPRELMSKRDREREVAEELFHALFPDAEIRLDATKAIFGFKIGEFLYKVEVKEVHK